MPPLVAVLIIWNRDEPMTTKTKKPSNIGPTGYWFPFFAVVSGTAPRLVMFFSNLSIFLSARRLDVVMVEGKSGGR